MIQQLHKTVLQFSDAFSGALMKLEAPDPSLLKKMFKELRLHDGTGEIFPQLHKALASWNIRNFVHDNYATRKKVRRLALFI